MPNTDDGPVLCPVFHLVDLRNGPRGFQQPQVDTLLYVVGLDYTRPLERNGFRCPFDDWHKVN
ncbi:hypothetical protein DDJ46_17945 [Mycobacteroides abscessus]|nr:hypothetical protein DDJ46_17945 [Mycobacteroides abscessus]